MALVVALAVTITVLVVRPDSDGPSATPTNGADSEFASANDTGPVNIITEDPTCKAWNTIAVEYSNISRSVKWGDRDQSVDSQDWSPDQKEMYATVRDALSKAADQTVGLIPQTPHRVMRELYEQFVAYSRAFISAIPNYEGDDRYLAGSTDGLTSGIAAICSAIDFESAQRLAPLARNSEPPSQIAPIGDPQNPQRYLQSGNEICNRWSDLLSKADADTAAWRAIDPAIPADEWTPEERSINEAVIPIMRDLADQYESLALESGNATLEDFGVLAAQYQRAFTQAVPTYTANDTYVSNAATYIASSIKASCRAAA